MSLLTAAVIFIVGLVSGVVVRSIAGVAAVVALVLFLLGVTSFEVSLVDLVLREYYLGSELLFLSGFLFGVAAAGSEPAAAVRDRDAA